MKVHTFVQRFETDALDVRKKSKLALSIFLKHRMLIVA